MPHSENENGSKIAML